MHASSLPSPPPAALDSASSALVSRIYCGRSIPGRAHGRRGATVTRQAVERFIREVLVREFPDGFTIFHGTGGWRDAETGGTITEDTLIIEVVHDAAGLDAVHRVAQTWKRWAQQQAVMVTTETRRVAFV